ncbi:MYND-type domain-containing protein [Mycena chlorophos]|uniref:MYND-type domain-containing protein n=1 Tax=Mycena chlorophos TaxID=658473 RepID=A0A8H6WS62_MYCCL|nr:MYND-type domain-containing protein [Mycena chlorophos]
MLLYEHNLAPDNRILKTYINTTTGRPVIMILKGLVRHVRQQENMTTLLLGGFGDEYAHVCGLLADLMDPMAESCESASTHRWVMRTQDGEHLIRVTFNQQVVVHDYNVNAPRYPTPSDRAFKPGMTVDCFLGLQNICYDEESFDDGFTTRCSRWLLQAIDVIKYPMEEPIDYMYVTPRLSMIIDALPPERKGMLDVVGGRVTTPAEEDQLLPKFKASM